MKIKKKVYKRQLEDEYWRGVKHGMQYAIDNPETAKQQIDNIDKVRAAIKPLRKWLDKVGKAIFQ